MEIIIANYRLLRTSQMLYLNHVPQLTHSRISRLMSTLNSMIQSMIIWLTELTDILPSKGSSQSSRVWRDSYARLPYLDLSICHFFSKILELHSLFSPQCNSMQTTVHLVRSIWSLVVKPLFLNRLSDVSSKPSIWRLRLVYLLVSKLSCGLAMSPSSSGSCNDSSVIKELNLTALLWPAEPFVSLALAEEKLDFCHLIPLYWILSYKGAATLIDFIPEISTVFNEYPPLLFVPSSEVRLNKQRAHLFDFLLCQLCRLQLHHQARIALPLTQKTHDSYQPILPADLCHRVLLSVCLLRLSSSMAHPIGAIDLSKSSSIKNMESHVQLLVDEVLQHLTSSLLRFPSTILVSSPLHNAAKTLRTPTSSMKPTCPPLRKRRSTEESIKYQSSTGTTDNLVAGFRETRYDDGQKVLNLIALLRLLLNSDTVSIIYPCFSYENFTRLYAVVIRHPLNLLQLAEEAQILNMTATNTERKQISRLDIFDEKYSPTKSSVFSTDSHLSERAFQDEINEQRLTNAIRRDIELRSHLHTILLNFALECSVKKDCRSMMENRSGKKIVQTALEPCCLVASVTGLLEEALFMRDPSSLSTNTTFILWMVELVSQSANLIAQQKMIGTTMRSLEDGDCLPGLLTCLLEATRLGFKHQLSRQRQLPEALFMRLLSAALSLADCLYRLASRLQKSEFLTDTAGNLIRMLETAIRLGLDRWPAPSDQFALLIIKCLDYWIMVSHFKYMFVSFKDYIFLVAL
ncbi:unnamed protein product [Protopolystoma xenopodis]|uniref:Uncharacterized protein n=1 Tax=Protopolystoma xenopodis TaxID=117903 RepID=A0A448XFR6_9PLAT|nr:unnamed protein product [Protopolystoma xenopodis]